jgi:hypothetical protein
MSRALRSRRRARASGQGAAPAPFRPEVERLEQRQVPSRAGSASFALGDGIYTLYQDGSIWSHTGQDSNTGWTDLTALSTSPATAVSGGVGYYLVDVPPNMFPGPVSINSAFALFADGSVWEYTNTNPAAFFTPQMGWVEVCGSGAVQISASQGAYDTVFVRFNDGSVWEHGGLSMNSGWSEVWSSGAPQISAGQDTLGSPSYPVYVLFNDGSVWEHTGQDMSSNWFEVWSSGATQIVASQAQPNTVFVRFGGALWEHIGQDPNAGWSEVWNSGVVDFSVGKDAAGNPAVFPIFHDGSVWEHTGTDPNAGWSEVWGEGATAMYASPAVADTAFVNFGGDLWEHIGQDPNAGWYEVWNGGVI